MWPVEAEPSGGDKRMHSHRRAMEPALLCKSQDVANEGIPAGKLRISSWGKDADSQQWGGGRGWTLKGIRKTSQGLGGQNLLQLKSHWVSKTKADSMDLPSRMQWARKELHIKSCLFPSHLLSLGVFFA